MIDVDGFGILEKKRTATIPEVAVTRNEGINGRTLPRRISMDQYGHDPGSETLCAFGGGVRHNRKYL